MARITRGIKRLLAAREDVDEVGTKPACGTACQTAVPAADLESLGALVEEAEADVSRAMAECRKLEREAAEIGAQLTAASIEPRMNEFESASAWRTAIDAQHFERHTLELKRDEVVEKHRLAADNVVEAKAQLEAAQVKHALAQAGVALQEVEPSQFNFTALGEFSRAVAAYYSLPSRFRENDVDLVEQVSRRPCQLVVATGAGGTDVLPAPDLPGGLGQ